VVYFEFINRENNAVVVLNQYKCIDNPLIIKE